MKTFTEHMQDCVGATCPLGEILYNLSPEEIEEEAHNYAKEVAREALKNAAENAIMKYHCGHFKTDTPTQYHQHGADNIQIDKQSILNEQNIPEL